MQSVISVSRPKTGKVRGVTEVCPGCDNFLTVGTAQEDRSYRAQLCCRVPFIIVCCTGKFTIPLDSLYQLFYIFFS